MKMVKNRCLGEKPLPGDRQGTLGATTEGGSKRVSGDRMLNRRTSVKKNTTAEHTSEKGTFVRAEIIGDGSCLFRAVSLYIYGHQNHHKQIREESLEYIDLNWSELQDYVLIEDDQMRNMENYKSYMAKTTTYGTSLEILALSETRKLNFHIYHKQRRTKADEIAFKTKPTLISKRKHTNSIYLLLTGNPEAGHFELLTPKANHCKEPESNNQQCSDEWHDGQGCHGNRLLDQNKTNQAMEEGTAQSVLPEQPATTKAGRVRQRMTWNDEMNRTVMRGYYLATKLESITTGYRTELHKYFTIKFPGLAEGVSEQRLIDQKRVILKNNRLTPQEIQEIKEEIAEELGYEKETDKHQKESMMETKTQEGPPLPETKHNTMKEQPNKINSQQIETTTNNQVQDDLKQKLREEMETNLTIWRNSDPTMRNILPRLHFKRDTHKLINTMNAEIITRYMDDSKSLEDIHVIIYAAAAAVLTCNGQKNVKHQSQKSNQTFMPRWQRRIENNISKLRADIGRLTQYISGNRSKKIVKHIGSITKNREQTNIEILDTLKQKLMIYSARLRRYKESNERRTDNALFNRNEKLFYRKITNTEKIEITPPSKEQVTEFWSGIWSKPVQHDHTASWIEQEENRQREVKEQTDYKITLEDLTTVIKNTQNWKSPGTDQIQNFWYKQFTSTHKYLTIQINWVIENPQQMPQFLTYGKTYIQPKNRKTENPANYRPITCLQTLYKIITAAICKKIDKHLQEYNIMTEEQKGCRKNSQGCKEQLIIDSIIMKQTEKQQRNLQTCFIDYKKAFDSVPHSWLKKVLQIYKINPIIRNFLASIMNTWKTSICLTTDKEQIRTDNIDIRRGIFQGDSLSALWFCICLNPLSNTLNNTKYGFQIKYHNKAEHTINHLLYMDDIKLYAPTHAQMGGLLKIVKDITTDIRMEFGIEKCKTLSMERGRWKDEKTTETLNNEPIDNMQIQETYKYLGFHQNTRIDHTTIKKELNRQYQQRLTRVLNTKLNSKHIFKAINTFAIPLLTYSFGIIKWSTTDLENINILTRSQLTKHRKLHPNSCKERLTIDRKEGGRGFIDIHILHATQIENLRNYFHNKQTTLHRAVVKADNKYTPLNLSQPKLEQQRIQTQQEKMEQWAQKTLHGKHLYIMSNEHVNKQDSYKWLQKGQLYPETEGFIIAIQDQVIATKNYQKHIMKQTHVKDTCRKCHLHQESIEHVIGGCKMLAGTAYTERHNIAAKIIHQALALKLKLTTEQTQYYNYSPNNILEDNRFKLYYDITIHTDKTISHNRPDITLQDKLNKITYLIDVAIPTDNNIGKKYSEKIEKYTPLAIEVERIWKQGKVQIIPFIISATGITHKTFSQHLEQLKLDTVIHELIQKAIILKTCNIVRSFLKQ